MKLLVSDLEGYKSYISREFFFVMTDLMTKYGWRQIDPWRLWDGSKTIKNQLLNEFGELPEAILFWESFDLVSEKAGQIRRLECNKYIFSDDLHWWDEEMRKAKLTSFALCNTVLSTYGYTWKDYYPEISTKRVEWVPHSASPDFMLPYNPQPKNSIFLSGAITIHYPLRQQMKLLQETQCYPIVHHCHPGYHSQYDYDNDKDVGRGYAELINKHRAGFTDSLIYKYVVAKYFEIPATGTLLLADDRVSAPLSKLGLMENSHYLPVSGDNLEERIRYVLDEDNHPELDEIRRRGQELIWEKHKTSDRARQINEVCRV
ncbi:MAG TPA: glycosyltransferase [Pyrinomonadaceae bacterium]